jgi:hypothetical protein
MIAPSKNAVQFQEVSHASVKELGAGQARNCKDLCVSTGMFIVSHLQFIFLSSHSKSAYTTAPIGIKTIRKFFTSAFTGWLPYLLLDSVG